MKIYFCDGCNESIPLSDIQAGQATTIKGKLFCKNCIPPGAGGPSQAAPAASKPRERVILGGHTVEIYPAPPRSSASGAGQ